MYNYMRLHTPEHNLGEIGDLGKSPLWKKILMGPVRLNYQVNKALLGKRFAAFTTPLFVTPKDVGAAGSEKNIKTFKVWRKRGAIVSAVVATIIVGWFAWPMISAALASGGSMSSTIMMSAMKMVAERAMTSRGTTAGVTQEEVMAEYYAQMREQQQNTGYGTSDPYALPQQSMIYYDPSYVTNVNPSIPLPIYDPNKINVISTTGTYSITGQAKPVTALSGLGESNNQTIAENNNVTPLLSIAAIIGVLYIMNKRRK